MRLFALEVGVDMKLNKKGMSMVEIIVSIALISIVLTFLMNLFLRIRTTYNQSAVQADYNILVANIVKAIGDDIDNYGLSEIEYETEGNKSAIILTFNAFRLNHLSDRIRKVLRVYFRNNKFYISYSYESKYTLDITSVERSTSVIREMPDDVVVDSSNYIELTKTSIGIDVLTEIKVPMGDANGNIYDINVFGLIKGQ